jgi:hypothetical protein
MGCQNLTVLILKGKSQKKILCDVDIYRSRSPLGTHSGRLGRVSLRTKNVPSSDATCRSSVIQAQSLHLATRQPHRAVALGKALLRGPSRRGKVHTGKARLHRPWQCDLPRRVQSLSVRRLEASSLPAAPPPGRESHCSVHLRIRLRFLLDREQAEVRTRVT